MKTNTHFYHISFSEKYFKRKLQRKIKIHFAMFSNVVFNKVFFIRPMVKSGRVSKTLL